MSLILLAPFLTSLLKTLGYSMFGGIEITFILHADGLLKTFPVNCAVNVTNFTVFLSDTIRVASALHQFIQKP